MIYRVLIVDDEPYIVNYISKMLLACTKYNLKVYKADSAKKALDLLDKHMIDVLLTDIEMPGLNGVELSKIVKDRYQECKMIFLSAYSDFEYAKGAVSSGVVEYVLKTQSDEKILESVFKCIEIIKKDRMSEKLIAKADKSIKFLMPYYRFRTLQVMYEMELMLDISVIKNRFDEVEIKIDPYKPFYVLICRIDLSNSEEYLSVEESINKSVIIHDIIYEKTKERFNCAAFHIHRSDKKFIYILLQENSLDLNKSKEYISKKIADIQSTVNTLLTIHTSFAFSGSKTDFEEWKSTFKRLEILLESYDSQNNKILLDNVNDYRIKKKETNADLSKIRDCLHIGDYRNSIKMIKGDFFNSNGETRIYYDNIALLIEYIEKNDLDKSSEYRLKSYDEFESIDMAYKYLENYIKSFCERVKKANESSSVDLVNRIKEYIKENIFKNLSLEEMAEDLYYNPSYLSRNFRAETGITLKAYFDKLRIEKIKELMRDESIMIKDIASKFNFDSPAYFSNYFKKHTGLTPNEYRKNK